MPKKKTKLKEGEILRRVLKETNTNLTKLTLQLGKSRGYLYGLFTKAKVDVKIIRKIGGIIKHDFKQQIPRAYTETPKVGENNEVIFRTGESIELDRIKEDFISTLYTQQKVLRILAEVANQNEKGPLKKEIEKLFKEIKENPKDYILTKRDDGEE